ncbi:ribosome silencing factor [Aphanothece hegewaldii CCALA 016]|uniref:Ribosomal silencing factor RsfS n=1 Tax=Aphanothece hegewaldii CCALA 016 TaxID=2107694 RepID=A0A2T1M0S9_9CHRO|nr:ribosome silencing factor [Aphanothece hegewaldii]PSF38195.1 ribosome silencing factor [Aphanothece hegewaldii CCALA 016]
MINQTPSPRQNTHLIDSPSVLDHQTELLVQTIAEAADEKKAADITILRTTDVSYLTDYLIIMTGFSRTQMRAISEAIEEKVAQNHEKIPLRVAGKTEASWILQDYGDVIVHILLPDEREFYNLEAFWGHAERIEFSPIHSV